MPKSSKAELAARVDEVLRIRLDGAQFHDIVQYASEKGWGVSDRQLWTYLRRADDLLVERQERKRKRLVARHLAQREALYARAVNAADYRTALAVLTDSAKLQELYTSERDLRELRRTFRDLDRRIVALGPDPGPARDDAGGAGAAPARPTDGR